jgi:Skp family chaperone for outer membrane proteins
MANGSVVSNGQSYERNFDFKPRSPEEEPKPDVARLAALARHLNADTDASDQPKGSARKDPAEAIGPTIQESSGSPKNGVVENDRRSLGARISRSVARFFIVALIGAGVTLAWQSHGEAAKQMLRTQAPSLAWLFPASTANSPSETQATSTAAQELKPMAADLAAVRRNVEQLGAQQEKMAARQQQIAEQQERMTAQQQQIAADQQGRITQSLAAMQALVQEIKQKVSSPPPSRTVATPPRAAQSPAVQTSPTPAQPPAGRPLPLSPLSR